MATSPDLDRRIPILSTQGEKLFELGVYAGIESDPYSPTKDVIHTVLTKGLSLKSPNDVLTTYIDGFCGGDESRPWGSADYVLVLLPEVGEPFYITIRATPTAPPHTTHWMKPRRGNGAPETLIGSDCWTDIHLLLATAREATNTSDQGKRSGPRAMMRAYGVPEK